jgi:hypothetical protein
LAGLGIDLGGVRLLCALITGLPTKFALTRTACSARS